MIHLGLRLFLSGSFSIFIIIFLIRYSLFPDGEIFEIIGGLIGIISMVLTFVGVFMWIWSWS